MTISFLVALLVYVFMLATNVLLIVAAFRTSARMGVLTLLVPVYAASVGNHRLRTERRRQLAAAWWAALACWVVLFMVVSR